MILETAILYVKPELEPAFERDFKIAGQYISSVNGYINHSLKKSFEQAGKYLLLAEWESMEAHTQGFRQSALPNVEGTLASLL